MAAVEHVGDVVDLLGPWGGVPGGGPQVDVTEPRRDSVHGHTGLEAVRGPVGAQRVRMREPLRHAGRRAAATHEAVHGDGGERARLLVSVTAEPHEQRLLIKQPDAAGEGMDLQPRLERLLHGQRHRDPALAPALPAHEQPVVPSIRTRTAEIASAEASELGGAKLAVTEHPQQGVVAFAGERAAAGGRAAGSRSRCR
jgi:hypothetical protein